MSPKDSKQMEQQIIESAEELFMDKGFALTSTTEIARKAGCNQTLVHYYFRTKENLFQAIFERKFRYFISNFKVLEDPGLDFREKLTMMISTHFDLILKNPRLPTFIITELTTNAARLAMIKESFAPVLSEIFSQFEKEYREAVRKKEIREMDLFDLILSILSLNIAPFLIGPIIRTALNLDKKGFQEFVLHRKEKNIEMIIDSLRPL